jgi:hypothetical protein
MLTKTISPLALCGWRLLRLVRRRSSGSSPKPMSPKIRPMIAVHSSSFRGDPSVFGLSCVGTERLFLLASSLHLCREKVIK